MCDERLAFLRRLSTWPTFGKGWARRVAEVRSTALAMAGQPAPRMATTKTRAGMAAGATIAGGGAAAVLRPDATPLIAGFVLLFVIVAGLVLWMARRRRAREVAHG